MIRQKSCNKSGCVRRACFGEPGRTSVRCGDHRDSGDENLTATRCSSEACLCYSNKHDRGFANKRNPISGKHDLRYSCFSCLFHDGKLRVRKEQFVLAEIQQQIPELEELFLTWDCSVPGSCTLARPDVMWRINETLLHVKVDEEGDHHEDNNDHIIGIHAGSGCKYHILIRFNPGKSSGGRPPCIRRKRGRSGGDYYEKVEAEWNHRMPILIAEVKSAFKACLSEGENMACRKKRLFF